MSNLTLQIKTADCIPIEAISKINNLAKDSNVSFEDKVSELILKSLDLEPEPTSEEEAA